MPFSFKFDWGFFIVYNAKSTSEKIEALIRSVKFSSPEVALYLYKLAIQPCFDYCCHVSAGATSCYLDMLDKLYCIFLLLPFLEIIRMSMSIVSFLAQLDSGILCLQNGYDLKGPQMGPSRI